MRKAQISLEYLFIFIAVLISIIGVLKFSDILLADKSADYSLRSVVSELRSAAETVASMGYPARQSINLYIPKNVDFNSTVIKNNTINFGVHHMYGLSDVFEQLDFCVKGSLPTSEGYYVMNIIFVNNCVFLDYKSLLYVEPRSVDRKIGRNNSVLVDFSIFNIGTSNVTVLLTSNGSVAPISDVDYVTTGRQIIYTIYNITGNSVKETNVTFFGDSIGYYTGYVYFNDFGVPITINVTTMRQNVTIFFEDFTPSPYYSYNWTRLGGTGWDSYNGANCYGGSGDCAHALNVLENQNITSNSSLMNTSRGYNTYVDFYIRENTALDPGDWFRLYCYNSTAWYNFYSYDMGNWLNTGQWDHIELVLPNQCRTNDTRFRMTVISNQNQEDVYIDDFRVINDEDY